MSEKSFTDLAVEIGEAVGLVEKKTTPNQKMADGLNEIKEGLVDGGRNVKQSIKNAGKHEDSFIFAEIKN